MVGYHSRNSVSNTLRKPLLGIFQAYFLRYYCFFSSALIADHTGSYVYAFYMTGGVLFAAFLIPVTLIFINWRKSKVHPQTSEVKENEEKKVDTISKAFQTEQVQNVGMEPRDGTLTSVRSSSNKHVV